MLKAVMSIIVAGCALPTVGHFNVEPVHRRSTVTFYRACN